MSNDDVPIQAFIAQRFDDHDDMHAEQAKAVITAVESMNRRLDAMNEMRELLNKVVANTVSRDYYELRHAELDKRLQALESDRATTAALDAQGEEITRTRKNLLYTVIGGLILMVADIVLAAMKR